MFRSRSFHALPRSLPESMRGGTRISVEAQNHQLTWSFFLSRKKKYFSIFQQSIRRCKLIGYWCNLLLCFTDWSKKEQNKGFGSKLRKRIFLMREFSFFFFFLTRRTHIKFHILCRNDLRNGTSENIRSKARWKYRDRIATIRFPIFHRTFRSFAKSPTKRRFCFSCGLCFFQHSG
jgi:hypothetical protein